MDLPGRAARAARTARLLSLPLGTAALAVAGLGRRVRGEDAEAVRRDLRARNAARTRRVLGEAKGGALKAGQLLSTVEALMPADPEDTWRQALTALQEDAGGLPFAEVEPLLRAELGPGWRSAYRRFEEEPVAAASLGQVHRAVRGDGREVAVKVQYPGVREALAGDLRAVSAVTRVAGLVAPGLALPPLVAEMRDRLVEELDYVHEADAQARFAAAYADDPRVVVPAVVEATPRVLVADWLDGTPLARVATTGTQAERDEAAALYQYALVSGPERAGLLHTDPHPGNVRVLPPAAPGGPARVGLLDFGSTLPMPGGMPPTFGRLIRVLLARDEAGVLAGLRAEGFVRPGSRVDARKLSDYLAPFSEPARHEEFRFSRAWLRGQFGRLGDPRDPDFAVALQLTLPAEHLFTHRVWLGMVGVLCQLEATVPVRPVLARWLPGFAPDPPA